MDVEEFDWEDAEIERDGEEVRFRARDLSCAFIVVFTKS